MKATILAVASALLLGALAGCGSFGMNDRATGASSSLGGTGMVGSNDVGFGAVSPIGFGPAPEIPPDGPNPER